MFKRSRHVLLLICFLGNSFSLVLAEEDFIYNPDYSVLGINYNPDYSLLNKEVFSSNNIVIPVKAGIFVENNQSSQSDYEIEDLIEEEDASLVSQSSSVEIPDPFSTWSEDSSALDTSKPLPTSLLISRFIFDPAGDDAGKEFIELRNESDSLIDLADYSIQTSTLKKNFESGMTIQPNSSFTILLGDASLTSSNQMLWKSGSLKNSTDTIYLVGSHVKVITTEDPAIIDFITYNSTDFADFSSGKIYQRKLKDGEDCPADLVIISGTYCRGHLSPSFKLTTDTLTEGGVTPPEAVITPTPATPGLLLIYRFLFDAVGADDGKEFIELYNETDSPINLADYSIQISTLKKNFETGMIAQPHTSFTILLGNTSTTNSNQMLWKSGSLSNSTGTIYLINSHTQVSSATDPTVLDYMIYNSTDFSNFGAGKIYQRKLKDTENCPADLANTSLAYCRGPAASSFKLVDF